MSFSHLDPTTQEAAWRQAGVDQLPRIDHHVLARAQRLIIVGAHPDDEALGCAALLATAAHIDLETHVVSYTSGEGSHPLSATHSAAELAQRRETEFHTAMRLLHPQATVELKNFPDGKLRHHEHQITQHLTELIAAGPAPVLLAAPFHQDGHTDHDTLGKLVRTVAKRANIPVLEYPIWYWHWAEPQDTRWHQFVRIPDPVALNRVALYAAYPSQLEPLSEAPGDEAIIGPEFLAHFQRGFDTVMVTDKRPNTANDAAEVFDELHAADEDPWQLATSAYEAQKRQALLDAMGTGYRRTLEVGCSIGTLSAELADHSVSVTAIDASQAAIDTAKKRYGKNSQIDFQCLTVPFEWPEGQFDLVVLSEIGYFMAPQQWEETLQRIHTTTDATFTLALCHWLGEIEDWPADAEAVHEQCRKFWPNATVVTTERTENYILEVLRIEKTTAQANQSGPADAS